MHPLRREEEEGSQQEGGLGEQQGLLQGRHYVHEPSFARPVFSGVQTSLPSLSSRFTLHWLPLASFART